MVGKATTITSVEYRSFGLQLPKHRKIDKQKLFVEKFYRTACVVVITTMFAPNVTVKQRPKRVMRNVNDVVRSVNQAPPPVL